MEPRRAVRPCCARASWSDDSVMGSQLDLGQPKPSSASDATGVGVYLLWIPVGAGAAAAPVHGPMAISSDTVEAL